MVTDDPERPRHSVDLTGNQDLPCFRTDPPERVEFNRSPLQHVSRQTVELENCGGTKGERPRIKRIFLSGNDAGVFDLEDIPDQLPLELDPQKPRRFQVTFEPPDDHQYTATLVVQIEDQATTRTLELVGRGDHAACPKATAGVRASGDGVFKDKLVTLPWKTVELTSSDSRDNDGSVERFEWSIIQKPSDSSATLVPSSSHPNPRLFLDRPGIYRLRLRVFDDSGRSSDCYGPATVTIDADPPVDTMIKLSWETPPGPSPTGGDHADLDLHYMSPKGTWNRAPYDIYAGNRTGDWGQPNKTDDDPRLVEDSRDGRRPEVLLHDNPVPGQAYSIGVHNFDSGGFKVVAANVRIYVDGKLRREFTRRLGKYEFWTVALVEWPTKNIYKRDIVTKGLPAGGNNP